MGLGGSCCSLARCVGTATCGWQAQSPTEAGEVFNEGTINDTFSVYPNAHRAATRHGGPAAPDYTVAFQLGGDGCAILQHADTA